MITTLGAGKNALDYGPQGTVAHATFTCSAAFPVHDMHGFESARRDHQSVYEFRLPPDPRRAYVELESWAEGAYADIWWPYAELDGDIVRINMALAAEATPITVHVNVRTRVE